MTEILVTGGAGNIGSAMVSKLAKKDDNLVVVADDFSTGRRDKIPAWSNIKAIKCDVNDYNDISGLFLRYHFDYVFHYAAVVGVQRTLAQPLAVLRDIRGIENILNLCKNTDVKRVYYSSSSEVYGEPFEVPQNEETTPLNSRLPYAIVKNLGEAYLKAYEKEYGLPYTIFRFFNTYGPNQSEDFVIPKFLQRAIHDDDITIYGDGMQTRTFCYIDDNVEACLTAHYEEKFINDTVNIGSDVEISIAQLTQMIKKITKSESAIVHLPPLPVGDMSKRCPDISKMRNLLSRDLIPIEDGIRRLVRFYQSSDKNQGQCRR